MNGFLFVVEPDESIFVGSVASLKRCQTESHVRQLLEYWQDRVGDDFVVLDSRSSPEWFLNGPRDRLSQCLQKDVEQSRGPRLWNWFKSAPTLVTRRSREQS